MFHVKHKKGIVVDEDYIKFCMKCGWNDCDYGCTCPSYEEVFQCDMYAFYHPDEVKDFEGYCVSKIDNK